MRIIFVRHGLTDQIVQNISQYATSELNKTGKEEAQQVAERLKDEPVDRIITSPLTRAKQTTEFIRRFHPDAEVTVDDRIQEIDCGEYIGRPRKHIMKERETHTGPWGTWRPEQGENFFDVQDRMVEFFESLDKEKDETIVVVSHGAALGFLMMHLRGLEPSQENFDSVCAGTTEVSILEWKDDEHEFVLLNCAAHLDKT